MILEELEVPFEWRNIPYSEIKQPAYEKLNPNGRVPTIEDPNTGITLWESGAIIEYPIDKYDYERKLSYTAGTLEAYDTKQ
jgi:glutathione S-transferase